MAFTLVETMVATTIFVMSATAMASLYLFSLKSFASLANYAALDQSNRQAMDKLTMEIRQAWDVTAYSTNPPSLSILNGDGINVTYSYSPTRHSMTRLASDGSSQVVVPNCNLLNFSLFQRNPSNANFGVFPLGVDNWAKTIKVVELTWKTSLTNAGTRLADSENVQTARIVIRKQH